MSGLLATVAAGIGAVILAAIVASILRAFVKVWRHDPEPGMYHDGPLNNFERILVLWVGTTIAGFFIIGLVLCVYVFLLLATDAIIAAI